MGCNIIKNISPSYMRVGMGGNIGENIIWGWEWEVILMKTYMRVRVGVEGDIRENINQKSNSMKLDLQLWNITQIWVLSKFIKVVTYKCLLLILSVREREVGMGGNIRENINQKSNPIKNDLQLWNITQICVLSKFIKVVTYKCLLLIFVWERLSIIKT